MSDNISRRDYPNPGEPCEYIRQWNPYGPRQVVSAEVHKVHAQSGRITIKIKTGMLLVVSGENVRRLK